MDVKNFFSGALNPHDATFNPTFKFKSLSAGEKFLTVAVGIITSIPFLFTGPVVALCMIEYFYRSNPRNFTTDIGNQDTKATANQIQNTAETILQPKPPQVDKPKDTTQEVPTKPKPIEVPTKPKPIKVKPTSIPGTHKLSAEEQNIKDKFGFTTEKAQEVWGKINALTQSKPLLEKSDVHALLVKESGKVRKFVWNPSQQIGEGATKVFFEAIEPATGDIYLVPRSKKGTGEVF